MKHHYVPQVHLKEFTQDGWFHEYDHTLNQRGEIKGFRRVHINQVCYEHNFYDLDRHLMERYKVSDAAILEKKLFFEFENKFDSLIFPFKNQRPRVHTSSMIDIIQGYLLQKRRTPYYRNQVDLNPTRLTQSIDKVLTDFAIEFCNHPIVGMFTTDESLSKFKEQMMNDKNQSKNVQITGLFHNLIEQDTSTQHAARLLQGAEIAVFDAPNGEFFLISDNPGFTLAARTDGRFNVFNTEFGSSNFQGIGYPVNSKQTLYLHSPKSKNVLHVGRDVTYKVQTSQMVDEVNSSTALMSDRKIFCVDRSYLERFVDKYSKLFEHKRAGSNSPYNFDQGKVK